MGKELKKYFARWKKEFNAARKLIKKYDKIAIFRHVSPDFDAIGTQLGLYHYLKAKYPEKDIKVLGEDSPNLSKYTFRPMDVVEDSWFEDDFLTIIVDVSDKERISDERFLKGKEFLKIDHHPNQETFSTVNITDTAACAAAEIVAAMLYYFEKCTSIGYYAAHNLYIAIVGDSGRFQYSSTSIMTFEIAELLLGEGLVLPSLYASMYEEDIITLEITKKLLNNYQKTTNGAIYYVLRDSDLKELNLEQGHVKGFVNTFAGIRGVDIWCSITEDVEKNCFWVSLRSKGIAVNDIAAKWRGGGHRQAAGARLLSEDEIPQLVKDLDDAILEAKKGK